MHKIVSLMIALILCLNVSVALCEDAAETEWDYIPFEVIVDRGVIDKNTMNRINIFIDNEQNILASEEWQMLSQEMSDLLHSVLLDNVQRECSSEAYLAKLCTWELVVIGIITVDQMYEINTIIEEYNCTDH